MSHPPPSVSFQKFWPTGRVAPTPTFFPTPCSAIFRFTSSRLGASLSHTPPSSLCHLLPLSVPKAQFGIHSTWIFFFITSTRNFESYYSFCVVHFLKNLYCGAGIAVHSVKLLPWTLVSSSVRSTSDVASCSRAWESNQRWLGCHSRRRPSQMLAVAAIWWGSQWRESLSVCLFLCLYISAFHLNQSIL